MFFGECKDSGYKVLLLLSGGVEVHVVFNVNPSLNKFVPKNYELGSAYGGLGLSWLSPFLRT